MPATRITSAEVLTLLKKSKKPLSIRDFQTRLKKDYQHLHRVLSRLYTDGLIDCEPQPTSGRGRPSFGYWITKTGRKSA